MTKRLSLALTGSIGMGKSTTAAMFADAGVAVWDADAAVHRLYAPGGGAIAPMAEAFPDAIEGGGVSRPALSRLIAADPHALGRIEAIVHPLVAADRQAFLDDPPAPITLCDVPLLFETGDPGAYDAVVVVSAPPEVQRTRVLARPGMTEAKFRQILARQMPDADKRARADHVIETRDLDTARQRVRQILDQMTSN